MAGNYGNQIARTVRQGPVKVNVSNWVQLVGVSGATTPLEGRQWIRIAPRGRDNVAIALKYVQKGTDGTFTTPTDTAHDATVLPSTGIYVEPVGDQVAIFARLVQRGGTSGGMKVIVTEYR